MQAQGRPQHPTAADGTSRKRPLPSDEHQGSEKRGCHSDRPVFSDLASRQNQQQPSQQQQQQQAGARIVRFDTSGLAQWSADLLRTTSALPTAAAVPWPAAAERQPAAARGGPCSPSPPPSHGDVMEWDDLVGPRADVQPEPPAADEPRQHHAAPSQGAPPVTTQRSFFFREFGRCSHILRARSSDSSSSGSISSTDMEI